MLKGLNMRTLISCQTAFFLVSQFYEGLGVLLHRKLVDVDTVLDLFDVRSPWRKVQPIVEGYRRKSNDPHTFTGLNISSMKQRRENNKPQKQLKHTTTLFFFTSSPNTNAKHKHPSIISLFSPNWGINHLMRSSSA